MGSRLRDVSLRTKFTLTFVLIVLCGVTVSTLIGSRIVTSAMLNEALKQLRHGLDAAGMVYASRLDNVRESVLGAAATEKLAEVARSDRQDRLPAVLGELRKENNLHFLSFVASDDGVIARASQAGLTTDRGSPASFSDLIASARNGGVRASTEVLSKSELEREDPTLALQAQINIVPVPMTAPDSRAHVDSGLVLLAAAPVSTRSGLRGVLYGGVLLNRDYGMVDQINQLVFGGEQAAGHNIGAVSIFMGDVRVTTNVMSSPGQRAVGTRISAEVAKAVLAEGQNYYGRAYVVTDWHLTAYQPIRDHAGRIVGILYVGIPEKPFLAVRTGMMLSFLLVAAAGVVVVIALTYFITRSMIHPLEEMVKASNRIAAGDFEAGVNVSSRDEIGILAGSFNKMLASIKQMKDELEAWGRTLEEKVKKRTEELITVQSQMAQSEKLASLGRLAAGVAHEVNNPLGGILTFSMLALEDCDEDHPMRQNLEIIVKQTMRCREIVKGLLDFARQSSTSATITKINSIVEKTLSLLENQAIFHNIRMVKNFDASQPEAHIDAGQLQQVVVNIVLNAADAMEESGVLTVETIAARESQEVLIRISDTGKGIPEEIKPFIFEPFFTTKKVGKGTGLGLSIVHGIVTRAGGKVEVASSSKGATFTVRLPLVTRDMNDEDEGPPKESGNRPGEFAEQR
ncbi:MAG TPA: cache domain-containing protein [Acidobacteriota bacterium]|nr:cache domain-containing protein [Acidobacteriota bacterium]